MVGNRSRDVHLYQQVYEPTRCRYRNGSTPCLLDLIVTNENDSVDEWSEWFLRIASVWNCFCLRMSVCVCVYVCVSAPEAMNNWWHDVV